MNDDKQTCEIQFFCEWVEYRNDEERKMALEYLNLWKFFALRKLDVKFIEDTIIDRPYWIEGIITTLAIKIKCEGKYET